MLTAHRTPLREVFFSAERLPNIYFYTSNVEKFLQARAVFERCGLMLKHYRGSTEPYSENYDLGKRALLTSAIDEVATTLGASSLFFVEDTSIRVEVLSKPGQDFPGLAAKEWFAQVRFDELDDLLQSNGNDRRAVVKSDVGLYVPTLSRPVFFEGQMEGFIADTPPNFEQSSQHPWLTPHTFNGWIIPKGATKRLGQMSFDESWSYDFRIRALTQLVDRLEEYTATLNLPSSTYTRRKPSTAERQLDLIPTQRRAFVIVGRTCAGKTTMGEYLASHHDFRFIEASSVLRLLASPMQVVDDWLAFARLTLSEQGPDVVARRILAMFRTSIPERLAITGFRTIEELECILQSIDYARVIFVDATERTRFERYLKRARSGEATTLTEFSAMDTAQWQFGLLRVAEDFADARISNEATLPEYHEIITSLVQYDTDLPASHTPRFTPSGVPERNQLFRCLEILHTAGRALTCGEIELLSSRSGFRIRHNNANKVLKRVPELAKRYEVKSSRIRYQVTDAGRAYVRLIRDVIQKRARPDV